MNKLLKENCKDEFMEILYDVDIPSVFFDLSLWDKEVIQHYLKISGMTLEELQEEIKPIDILY